VSEPVAIVSSEDDDERQELIARCVRILKGEPADLPPVPPSTYAEMYPAEEHA
jgi:hypothetical protein